MLGSILTVLGYITGGVVLVLELKKRNLWTEKMVHACGIGIASGLILARLGEFLFDGWPTRLPWSAILDPRLGGKSLGGGVLGGWIALEIAKRKLGIKATTGDAWALALPAGEAVGRIGCHFNECCFGRPYGGVFSVFQHETYRYPTQILSSVTAALIFLILFKVRNRIQAPGLLFSMYLFMWGFTRFFIEGIREAPTSMLGLTAMQWFSTDMMVAGTIGGIRKWIKWNKTQQANHPSDK